MEAKGAARTITVVVTSPGNFTFQLVGVSSKPQKSTITTALQIRSVLAIALILILDIHPLRPRS